MVSHHPDFTHSDGIDTYRAVTAGEFSDTRGALLCVLKLHINLHTIRLLIYCQVVSQASQSQEMEIWHDRMKWLYR